MSKSGSGEILDIDPAAIEAAMGLSDAVAPVDTASYMPADTFVNSPDDAGVSMAAPAEIPAVPAMSAIEQFYGSPTRITQPDAGYYDEFPLPGQAPAAVSAPQDPPYVPPTIPYIPLADAAEPVAMGAQSVAVEANPYAGLSGIGTFEDGRNFIRDMFLPDMSQYITAEDVPTFQQFDPTQLQDQIDQLALAEPINTSQFLTAADLPTYDMSQFLTESDLPTYQQFDPTQLQDQIDQLALAQPLDTSQFLTMSDLPTYDTSQFLTSADLPTYQQFDPTGLQEQINALQSAPQMDTSQFLTAADLPTYNQFDPSELQSQITALQNQPAVDTSQFLTTADLPTYEQFDPTALQQELAALKAQMGLLSQTPNQSFAQTQPYAPILDFAVR